MDMAYWRSFISYYRISSLLAGLALSASATTAAGQVPEDVQRERERVEREREAVERDRERIARERETDRARADREREARERADQARAERERAERDRGNERNDQSDPQSDANARKDGDGATAWTNLDVGRVSATGTGCPSGAWRALIDADEDGLAIRFSKLQAEVTPERTGAATQCRLSIALPARAGARSYQIGRFIYTGYVYLEKGVSAQFATSYAFAGDSARAQQVSTDLVGPLDEEYSVIDRVVGEGLWSPCIAASTLIVDMSVRLQNGATRADGIVEVADVTGLELKSRSCK